MLDTAWRPGARDWIAQRPGVEQNMTAKRKARDFYQWSAVLIDQRGFQWQQMGTLAETHSHTEKA